MITRRMYMIGSIAAALAISASAAKADLLDTIKSAGVLRAATPQDSPPFGIPGPDMKIVGYDIDISRSPPEPKRSVATTVQHWFPVRADSV